MHICSKLFVWLSPFSNSRRVKTNSSQSLFQDDQAVFNSLTSSSEHHQADMPYGLHLTALLEWLQLPLSELLYLYLSAVRGFTFTCRLSVALPVGCPWLYFHLSAVRGFPSSLKFCGVQNFTKVPPKIVNSSHLTLYSSLRPLLMGW